MTTSLCGLLVVVLCVAGATVASAHECKRTCVRGAPPKKCEYHFKLEWYRTLSKSCFHCPFNYADCFRPGCVSGNGIKKPIISINRQVPGPAIEVCEGDEVVVYVTNEMMNGETTSMHWHGIHHEGTPFCDGFGQITQCNIGPKESFRYNFRASPAGTHWYHSHTGMQLADGVFGAFIIRQPAEVDPASGLYTVDDTPMIIGDWSPVSAMSRFVDVVHDNHEPILGLHVNGRARHVDVPNENSSLPSAKTPMEVLEVLEGKSCRLRVIGASSECPIQVAIENHRLTVIAADGQPVVPRVVDAFIVFPGERYDFVLNADQPVANYWIKLTGTDSICGNAHAILRYRGAPVSHPLTDPMFSTVGKTMLNAYEYSTDEATGKGHDIIFPQDMRSHQDADLTQQKVDKTFYLDMRMLDNDYSLYNDENTLLHKRVRSAVINNITFTMPPIPILTQPEDVNEDWFCNTSSIDTLKCSEELCQCVHTLRVQPDQIVELVLYVRAAHPIHLHGHKFWLIGRGRVNGSDTIVDIEQADYDGRLDRNYLSPPLRDTFGLQSGGWAILRFKASNPGYWFFHCHIDTHLERGMGLLLKVGDYKDFAPIPDHFPKCGGYGFKNADRRPPAPQPCVEDDDNAAGRLHVHLAMIAVFVGLSLAV